MTNKHADPLPPNLKSFLYLPMETSHSIYTHPLNDVIASHVFSHNKLGTTHACQNNLFLLNLDCTHQMQKKFNPVIMHILTQSKILVLCDIDTFLSGFI